MNKTGKKLKKKSIALLVFVILVLVPILLIIINYCVYLYQFYSAPERSLSRYCSISDSAWEVRQPYVIFPELDTVNSAEETEYLQKTCISPFFFIERQNLVYLVCCYGDEQYQTEVVRLEELCGEIDTETFAFPAYVYYGFYPNGCCEYAVIDEASHTIYYLSFQGSMLLKEHIPEWLQPKTKFYFGKAENAETWDGGNF